MKKSTNLELYHWDKCGYSAAVMIALLEKGLTFRSHYVDVLALDQYAAEYLEISPSGHVPALAHNGCVFVETTAILEYLEEAFPAQPLMPADALGRWLARVFMKRVNEDIAPAVSTLGWHSNTLPGLPHDRRQFLAEATGRIPIVERRELWSTALVDDPPLRLRQQSIDKLLRACGDLESRVAANLWIAGEIYSLADVSAFPFVATFPTLLPDAVSYTQTPGIMRWLHSVRERAAVQELLAASPPFSLDALQRFAPGPEHIRWG